MTTNRKKLLIVETMPQDGWAVFEARGDIDAVRFSNAISAADFNALLREHAPVHGVALGATAFGRAELESAGGIEVVARMGVGFDAVDVPVMTGHRVPVMTTGIANSPSVAEAALFMMLALAKRAAELDALVKSGGWSRRLGAIPYDLYGKTVLVVGFGRIGSRTAKRCLAMDMTVLVHDPFKPDADIEAAGYTPAPDLDAALPVADFVTLHCPKTPQTLRMIDAARLKRMKPTAYLINTARGGIVDEAALHAALTSGALAGAGLDVFEKEPAPADNPLFRLDNVITAPHVAGVTSEALDRMGLQTARNIVSALDGAPIADNVVNREVLG
ncbi:hydroxyacid dehydrogenase [Bradyrhizobium sp. U87765 SZCCT0131]|uniref:hydroxyacid dehydrogenase n=1 Tax=unclassified Bradyrhizobium TaxID=2631580 RepID=UPI001BA8F130|nr:MULTISPECIES: hydroxyacid dehydrogenase [unclassified Bradyrhizobium]MBR1222583.1 hydroxyacid dehydrogenase [Bradyrhizobium sp. U87765 SZCCT0131]MBR1265336.1 hydroxyacid dehydrogenase [Bradyrhizobium sp. U87765 SZCCT0134]MBR1302885.1 hydroxyacid dehydrogenase [Bradyrhizobium sp. U87765 SZCCT0110]MBR1323583.1 hydroxyacid dehydrogenase [Bradyrhizobium sp. U87765 SZCCT0109]MBR1346814.1 hydroxyacid dehydrogenase [Bradyrhizobium sp. U87765 SZCCT0048]